MANTEVIKKKAAPVLREHLPVWAENHLQFNAASFSYVFEGRLTPRANLHSSFCKYLALQDIFLTILPRMFQKELESYLESKEIVFQKHRVANGFILQGVEILK